MKIAHLTYSDSEGGAAIGAFRLHQAMLNRGVDSHLFVLHSRQRDARIHALLRLLSREEQRAAHKLTRILQAAYGVSELPIRNFNLFGVDTATVLNAFEPDIVQMHWIANNTIRLDDLRNVSAPLVWKMPDMWPFCGGEHYINADEPQRHRLGYDASAPARGEQLDVDRFVWEYKRRCYAGLRLTVTSPSRFLAREAHASSLLGAYDCHVIPNPFPEAYLDVPALDAERRRELRASLGVPPDRLVVMFAAFHARERRKGFHHIQAMLEHHLPSRVRPEDVYFLVVGGKESKVETFCGYEVRTEPTTTHVRKYLSYLQASDLLLFPSEMDSTAMVVSEAAACGVPAVTFAVGGLTDLVHHGKSGFLAPPYDAEKLAEGIVWWRDHPRKDEVAAYCRRLARSMHDETRSVARYLALYESVLARARTGRSFATAQLHDRDPAVLEDNAARLLLVVDPSVRDVVDSSHNTELALSACALAAAHGMRARIVGNAACRIAGVEVEARFDYSAYDKLRAGAAGEKAASYEDVGHGVRAERACAVLEASLAGLGARDAVFFPMADRPCVDGLLRLLARHDSSRLPSFHLNLMFERAEFLVGGYPLAALLRALKNTGYVGSRIFLYAETEPMAEAFAALEQVKVEVLPPLPLMDAQPLAEAGVAPAIAEAFGGLHGVLHAGRPQALPEKKDGEFWVAALGRGRRDKGFARLPGIVEAARRLAPGVRFLVQRPRKMDRLDAAVDALAACPEVLLLDELVDNDTLEALGKAADLVLLPYEASVYGKRGSAFAWKAVANLTPLVVARDTALREAIRWGNGLAAGSEAQFAEAIAAIRAEPARFKERARAALRELMQAAVARSPLVRNAVEAQPARHETILVVGAPPAQLAALADARRGLNAVRLHTGEADSLPAEGDASFLVLGAQHGALPALARDAIGAGRFKELIVADGAAPGTREALLACGALPALVVSAAESTLARPEGNQALRDAVAHLLEREEVRERRTRRVVQQAVQAAPAAEAPAAVAAAPQPPRPTLGERLKGLLAPLARLREMAAPAPSYQGCVDGIGTDIVKGWVFYDERPNERVELEVRVRGAVVAKGVADFLRNDINFSSGDGHHGFRIRLPREAWGADPREVAVHVAGRGEPLRFSNALAERFAQNGAAAVG